METCFFFKVFGDNIIHTDSNPNAHVNIWVTHDCQDLYRVRTDPRRKHVWDRGVAKNHIYLPHKALLTCK